MLGPKHCGRVYNHDTGDQKWIGQSPMFDGFILGNKHSLDSRTSTVYVGDNELSRIDAYGGNTLYDLGSKRILATEEF